MAQKTTAVSGGTAKSSKDTEESTEFTMEEKLDMIVLYLHRMDRRDRLRTVGGLVRGLLGLIPLVLIIVSFWFFMKNGEEYMMKLTREAVRMSAEYSQENLMDQLELYMNEGQ